MERSCSTLKTVKKAMDFDNLNIALNLWINEMKIGFNRYTFIIADECVIQAAIQNIC